MRRGGGLSIVTELLQAADPAASGRVLGGNREGTMKKPRTDAVGAGLGRGVARVVRGQYAASAAAAWSYRFVPCEKNRPDEYSPRLLVEPYEPEVHL